MLRRTFMATVLVALLAACGGAPAATVSGQSVIDALKAAGIQVENVKPGVLPADTPVPRSFKENITFTIPRLGDKGGQIFVCDTKQNCDAIFKYYDALKALAGPYLYQSPSGTVVAQLNSGLTPDEAKQFDQVIGGLK